MRTDPREGAFAGRELERHPDRFIGLTVTLVGKEAIRWENTTIASVDGDVLLLAGGRQVTQIFSACPVSKPITRRNNRIPCSEVARGFQP